VCRLAGHRLRLLGGWRAGAAGRRALRECRRLCPGGGIAGASGLSRRLARFRHSQGHENRVVAHTQLRLARPLATDLRRPWEKPTTFDLVVAGGLIGTAAVAVVVNAIVAAIAHAAGASDGFQPLHLATYAVFTVFGVLAAAAAWAIISGRSAHPARLLRTLVPVALIVSLIPDIMVGISDSLPGTSWGAVIALMVMHVVVAAVAIPAYQRLLPLPAPQD
jgi:hypothetical protein